MRAGGDRPRPEASALREEMRLPTEVAQFHAMAETRYGWRPRDQDRIAMSTYASDGTVASRNRVARGLSPARGQS